ncbi:hypothetical protein GCM10020254_04460 [Streptomyces goshikiensis]
MWIMMPPRSARPRRRPSVTAGEPVLVFRHREDVHPGPLPARVDAWSTTRKGSSLCSFGPFRPSVRRVRQLGGGQAVAAAGAFSVWAGTSVPAGVSSAVPLAWTAV